MNQLNRKLSTIVEINTELAVLAKRRKELVRQISENSSATRARAHWLISTSLLRLLGRSETPSSALLQREVRAIAGQGDRFSLALCDSWLSDVFEDDSASS